MSDDPIVSLIEVGVPISAISKALNIELSDLRDLQRDLRIAKYGTAELAEAMQFAIWKAYDNLLEMMETAPLATRIRISMTLVSRASSLAGSATPDSIAKMQQEMASLAEEMTETQLSPSSSIYATDTFDAPIDDPEEGSED
jgi:hypothetical protein